MTWFNISRDRHIVRCDTEWCEYQASFRLEAGGVGSNYCSACKIKIEGLETPGAGTLSRDNLTTKGE